MNESKTAVLMHYASKYYDPQKAHEYYMRTRELKGRSTSTLTDDGKKFGRIQKIVLKKRNLPKSNLSRSQEIKRFLNLEQKLMKRGKRLHLG